MHTSIWDTASTSAGRERPLFDQECAVAARGSRVDFGLHLVRAQYLTHTVDWEGGVVGKVAPPIREAADAAALWAALKAGKIDVVATDHVHRPSTAKAGGIWNASPGFPGLQTRRHARHARHSAGGGLPRRPQCHRERTQLRSVRALHLAARNKPTLQQDDADALWVGQHPDILERIAIHHQ